METDEELKSLIYHHGPVSAAINITTIPKGIKDKFNGWCPSDPSNSEHYVLIVGWEPHYWITKNSWGPEYGLDGYLYLRRDVPNKCGLFNDLVFPFFGGKNYLNTNNYYSASIPKRRRNAHRQKINKQKLYSFHSLNLGKKQN